jgi:hypothetical protein
LLGIEFRLKMKKIFLNLYNIKLTLLLLIYTLFKQLKILSLFKLNTIDIPDQIFYIIYILKPDNLIDYFEKEL